MSYLRISRIGDWRSPFVTAANREVLASIDINPVLVLPEGQGVAALDAVILTV